MSVYTLHLRANNTQIETVCKTLRASYPQYYFKTNYQTSEIEVTKKQFMSKDVELAELLHFAKGALQMVKVLKIDMTQIFG